VSSRQPSDIPAFNREMIKLFGERIGKAAKSQTEKPTKAA
jgi:hypothetical protein